MCFEMRLRALGGTGSERWAGGAGILKGPRTVFLCVWAAIDAQLASTYGEFNGGYVKLGGIRASVWGESSATSWLPAMKSL